MLQALSKSRIQGVPPSVTLTSPRYAAENRAHHCVVTTFSGPVQGSSTVRLWAALGGLWAAAVGQSLQGLLSVLN